MTGTLDGGSRLGPRQRRRALLRTIGIGLAVLVLGVLGFVAYAWRSPIPPVEPPPLSSFNPGTIERGRVLAAVGDCSSCHTAPGGKSFGGGLPLGTPFGVVYVPNITRDVEAGIGGWSEAAFLRAMREGVGRNGDHLYPAFPFDHFTLATDEDVSAIYAFLMTREPAHEKSPPTRLPFPLNQRIILAGWKALFFSERGLEINPAKDAAWNRGAYLVEGLGHCGSCHTPRNVFGAEELSERYSGGGAEGWSAYAINAASPAPVPWDTESLAQFLKDGFSTSHGVAGGAMAPVVANLADVPDEDIHAMATYVGSLMGSPSPAAAERAADLVRATDTPGNGLLPASAGAQVAPLEAKVDAGLGEAVYAAVCATCHESRRPPPYGGIDLRLSTAVNAPSAQNALNSVLFGMPAAQGVPGSIMPGFAASLRDDDVVALLDYLRSHFTDKPAWRDIADLAAKTRSGSTELTVRSADGTDETTASSGGR